MQSDDNPFRCATFIEMDTWWADIDDSLTKEQKHVCSDAALDMLSEKLNAWITGAGAVCINLRPDASIRVGIDSPGGNLNGMAWLSVPLRDVVLSAAHDDPNSEIAPMLRKLADEAERIAKEEHNQ